MDAGLSLPWAIMSEGKFSYILARVLHFPTQVFQVLYFMFLRIT